MRGALKKLGLWEDFSNDDVINASTEDAARDHSAAVHRLHEGIEKRLQGDDALRRSIFIAKVRSNSFSDFERRIRKEINGNAQRRRNG